MKDRVPALIAGALLTLVGVVLLTAHPSSRPPAHAVPEQTRLLNFADVPGGAVSVADACSHAQLDMIHSQSGFLRITLAGLSRIRRTRGLPLTAPWRLSAYSNGAATLTDPETGIAIELEAFGPDNEGAFTRYLGRQAAASHCAAGRV